MPDDFPLTQGLLDLASRQNGTVLQTHISWVVLLGDLAYKIKKPVDFGFLDFSTLPQRLHACQEELRLNRRLAADWYLAVVPICGTPAAPQFEGAGEPFEYAVKMRRFPPHALLDELLGQGAVSRQMIEQLADSLADFHHGCPAAPADGTSSAFGTYDSIVGPARQNFAQLAPFDANIKLAEPLARLAQWTENAAAKLQTTFSRRLQQDHVRECHGDLHAGNIAWIDGEPVIFDAIEFNADFRWIDTISEIAFLVMDLYARRQPQLARAALNRYLEQTGDYAGVAVLDFYLVYRAMVRAKIAAFEADWQRCRDYLQLARGFIEPPPARLYITHGLSGSGKSTVSAAMAATEPRLIRIRSDVERKRLFGLPALASSRAAGNIYTPEATRLTYRQIMDDARLCLASGYSCIVDAAFLRRNERLRFAELARAWQTPYTLVSCQADQATLISRLHARQRAGNDASEADESILHKQLTWAEPLNAAELAHARIIRSP